MIISIDPWINGLLRIKLKSIFLIYLLCLIMISPQKSLLNLSCRPCDMHCYVRSYAWRLCGNARCRRSEMCRQVPRTGTGTFLQQERRNQYKRTKEMEVLLKMEYAVICCVIFMCYNVYIYIYIILYSQFNEALNNKCSMGGIPLNPTKNVLICLCIYCILWSKKWQLQIVQIFGPQNPWTQIQVFMP